MRFLTNSKRRSCESEESSYESDDKYVRGLLGMRACLVHPSVLSLPQIIQFLSLVDRNVPLCVDREYPRILHLFPSDLGCSLELCYKQKGLCWPLSWLLTQE